MAHEVYFLDFLRTPLTQFSTTKGEFSSKYLLDHTVTVMRNRNRVFSAPSIDISVTTLIGERMSTFIQPLMDGIKQLPLTTEAFACFGFAREEPNHVEESSFRSVYSAGFDNLETREFQIASLHSAQAGLESGAFSNLVTPYSYTNTDGDPQVAESDSSFQPVSLIRSGTPNLYLHCALSVLITNRIGCERLGHKHAPRIAATDSFFESQLGSPQMCNTIRSWLLSRDVKMEEVDLWQVSECPPDISLRVIRNLELPKEKVNPLGGDSAFLVAPTLSAPFTLVQGLTANERLGARTTVILCLSPFSSILTEKDPSSINDREEGDSLWSIFLLKTNY